MHYFNNTQRWKIIHVLAITGLLIRISVAFYSDHIHHPDEIFQYLEQAHRIVFGYSYIPWEYRFGTRSWILPGFISTFLYGFKFLKIDEPVLYINFIKLVFCCISTSLIYTVYIATKELASESAGQIAAIFTCFWYELVYFSHKPNPEVLATYLFMAALVFAVINSDSYNSLFFGLFCALTIILRFQYMIPVSILIFYVLFKWKRKQIKLSALTFFIIIGFAGFIDSLTWGKFFVSYYNNYVFNKIYNIASLFGTDSLVYYFGTLTLSSMGIFSITGLLSFFYLRNTWLLLLCASSIIISHSIIPHKEHRFVFLVIPILLMLLSIILTRSAAYYRHILKINITIVIFSMIFLISLAGFFKKLPFQQLVYKNSVFSKNDILKAYVYLYKESELYAILDISRPWYRTGGYYYLHRDVPIYRSEHFNLNENRNYLAYISHIVCPTDYEEISGFNTIMQINSVEIRRQVNPSPKYKGILCDTKIVLQKGIDDEFKPIIIE